MSNEEYECMGVWMYVSKEFSPHAHTPVRPHFHTWVAMLAAAETMNPTT